MANVNMITWGKSKKYPTSKEHSWSTESGKDVAKTGVFKKANFLKASYKDTVEKYISAEATMKGGSWKAKEMDGARWCIRTETSNLVYGSVMI